MMIRKDFLVAVSVLILLASPLLSIIPIAGSAAGEEAEVSAPVLVTSDLVVNSGDVVELDTVEYDMAGDIIVQNGGMLYINDSYIQFNCTSHGEYGISVEQGGVLHILNSNITAVNTTAMLTPLNPNSLWEVFYGLGWYLELKGDTRINGSSFSYMWGDQGNTQYDIAGGAQIYWDNVTVKDTLIRNSCNTGISILDEGFNYNSGVSPIIDTVTVYNTSGIGMMIMGDDSAPYVYDSRFLDNSNQGAYFFIGVDAMVNDSVFKNNGQQGVVFHDSSVSGADSGNEFHNCTFVNNAHGVGFSEGSGGSFYDCVIKNNEYSGVVDTEDSSGSSDGAFVRCEIFGNPESGVNITSTASSLSFFECNIHDNDYHGADIDTATGVYFHDTDIIDNEMFGVWANGTADPILDECLIQGNMDGSVRATNGSIPRLVNSDLMDSKYGVQALNSNPSFTGNTIMDNEFGIFLSGDCSPSFNSGDLVNNGIGIYAYADGVNVFNQTISGSTVAGVVLREGEGSSVRFTDLSGNEIGIRILGGDHTRIANTTVEDSTTGFVLESGANITVRGSDTGSNSMDFSLEGGSVARTYSMGISSSDVNVIDETSEFWHYWSISLEVYDNVTFSPVTQAYMSVFSNEGDLLTEQQTFFDGTVRGDAAQFNVIGGVYTDLTPVNLTVWKDGYVPYIDQDHPHIGDYSDVIYIAENKAPSLPFPPNGAPKQTHNNRPLITWDPPYDWNMDDIDYRVTVWQDELGTGQVIVDGEIVPEPEYKFTKNLRYNHEFWVEVLAYDPWGEPYGLNDMTTFSFRTFNNPPSRPNVDFVESPVPSLVDIEIEILNASVDIDTNPVDNITYLVQWEAYREGSWSLIKSGSNAFILDQNLTREGDRIRATVKPFDGIEYGEAVELIIEVVNFVPQAIVKYAEIELDEDTPESGLIDINELFMDRDGDTLSFNVKVARHIGASIDPVTNEITFLPDPDYQGSDYLILEASDSKPHTEENPTVQINITVNGLNDPPVINEVNEIPVEKGTSSLVQSTQGTNVVITVLGEDPDGIYGDSVTYSTDFLDVVGSDVLTDEEYMFEISTGRMSVYLKNELVGTHDFNITITDDNGESTSTPIRLIVENRNDGPTVPEITSHENGELITLEGANKMVTFRAEAADDPDLHIPGSEEYLEYDWNFGDGWIENRGLEFTREFIVSGNYTIQLRVRDSMGLYEESSIRVQIAVDEDIEVPPTNEEEDPFPWLIVILIAIAVIVLVVIILVIIRKDDLSDTAGEVEQEHEALVAKQQEEALVAQERLQSLMSGMPYPETSGPALPSGEGEGAGYDALPAASGEGGEPPMEGQQPPMDQYPPQEQPAYQEPQIPDQPVPEQQPPAEPVQEASSMQGAYEPTTPPEPQPVQAPMPEQQQAAPVPDQQQPPEPGMAPPEPEQQEQKPSYLPPEEKNE